MRILIYRTGRLGDFLVAVPAMQLIRKAYPYSKITLITTASTKARFANKTWTYADPANPLPWLDFVMPKPIDEVLMLGSLSDLGGLHVLRKEIRQRSFNAVFILPFSTEPFKNRFEKWIFLRLMGVTAPIWGLRGSKWSIFSRFQQVHQVEAAISAARQCPTVGLQSDGDIVFDLHIYQSAIDWAKEEIWKRDWRHSKIVAVFAGGTYAHKRWAPENFASVCIHLANDPATVFLLVGSASERPFADPIARALNGRCWNACGETNLHQLAALLKQCVFLLGNDSGPGHLAAALGIPCITLMSSIHVPGLWEPWGNYSRTLRHFVPCANCQNETHCQTGTEACIRGIEFRDTYNACRQFL